MKKIISIFLLCAVVMTAFCGCTAKSNIKSDKIKVVATLFPQYDFARVIAGDKADVTMLLTPGVDSHSYDPTTADIINVNKSDLFIYTGKYMESWAQKLINSAPKSVKILDVSEGISLDKEDHDHEEEEHDHDEQEHIYNPHIWTSPKNAEKMVDNILKSLCEIDPDNSDYYTENADKYKQQLSELDTEFRSIVSTAKRKTMLFASRFALHYFAEEYGLSYVAAIDSCSAQAQASTKAVANIISMIKADNIPVVYYEELTDPKTARMVADETGCKILLFHSCHNVSKDEMKSGATYISLMQQNAKNLKEGLN